MVNLPQSLFSSSLHRSTFRGIRSSDEYILLPERDVRRAKHRTLEGPKQSWRDGHHFGVLCCTITATVVLLINVLLCIVAGAKHEVAGDFATLYDGDCGGVKRLDLWLHLLINVLSTLLLGASNYSMQCLSAPTRKDIDEAHSENVWMDIGVPSLRNIRRISWLRKILWCCLVLSSVPLHLMYNSVVFSSTSLSEPRIYFVTNDFLAGAPYNVSQLENGLPGSDDPAIGLQQLKESKNTSKLDVMDCQKAYGSTTLISEWGDAIAVTTMGSQNNSVLGIATSSIDHKAMCALEARCQGDSITLGGGDQIATLSYCMASKAIQHCRIRFSVGLMIGVIACNLVKIICMSYVVWRLDPRLLVTLGDAIASFLEHPDPTTTGKCLFPKTEFQKASSKASSDSFLPLQYLPQGHRRLRSASIARWLSMSGLIIIALIASASLLKLGVTTIEANGISPFSIGFGAISTDATIEWSISGITASVLVANCPQLILSFLYFAYNGVWTCMLMVEEWAGYFKKRKPLRVTSRSGSQRSTYRLQLPYRYGIPLMALSAVLHWLVSRSIFLVVLNHYRNDGTPDPDHGMDVISCGYSPIAILTTIIVGTLVLVIGVANGFRRYPEVGIPLAGSCSAAISAACHPPPGDNQPSKKAVMWGAVRDSNAGEESSLFKASYSQDPSSTTAKKLDNPKVGHCTFTSLPVDEPTKGELYAGLKRKRS